VRFDIRADAGAANSDIYKELNAVAGAVQLDFDVKVGSGSFAMDGVLALARLEMYPPPPGLAFHQLSFGLNTSGSLFDYYRSAPPSNLTTGFAALAPGWRHITVTASFHSLPAVAKLAVDGIQVAESNLDGNRIESIAIGLGTNYARNLNAAWALYYDNVEVRTF
jgi:hypothetical protein